LLLLLLLLLLLRQQHLEGCAVAAVVLPAARLGPNQCDSNLEWRLSRPNHHANHHLLVLVLVV
jgi:hypothetical protein